MTAASAPAATDAGEKAPRRLDSLTGLRFLAALVVVCSHLPAALGLRGRILLGSVDEELALGGAGVLFFFLLSGFVLCWSRRAGDRPLDFYGRRFARIYPNVVVAVGVTAAERPAERRLWPCLSRLASSCRPGSPAAGTTVDRRKAAARHPDLSICSNQPERPQRPQVDPSCGRRRI